MPREIAGQSGSYKFYATKFVLVKLHAPNNPLKLSWSLAYM